MVEALLALGSVATLYGAVWAWSALAPDVLLAAGFWIVAAGLGFGVPTGLLYHAALRRALLACGRLPRRWWLRPLELHPLLPSADRFRVLLWCRLGAFGCAVAFVGCAVFGLGALRLLLAARAA